MSVLDAENEHWFEAVSMIFLIVLVIGSAFSTK